MGVRSLRVDLAWLGLAAVPGHYQSLTNVAARPKHRVRTKTSMIVIEKGEMINQITSEVGFIKENLKIILLLSNLFTFQSFYFSE